MREDRPIQLLTLLPPPPGCCPECAIRHDPADPHDPHSMYYQMRHRIAGYPTPATWADAMAHCDDATKALWTEQLLALGVEVGELTPKKATPDD